MNSFDDEIRGAFQAGADDAALRTAGDEGLIRQISATFRGRMRKWVLLTWAATLLWVGVGAWAAAGFFRSEDARGWIMHAAIFLTAAMAVAMLKLWYMMELNRSTQTREIKRIELQLARLAERLK